MTLAIILNLLPLLAPLEVPPVDCTFANPRYAGHCVEQVTPMASQTPVEACQVVLTCLNDPRCVKNYCRATTVRGGWTLVSPKPKKKTDADQRPICTLMLPLTPLVPLADVAR